MNENFPCSLPSQAFMLSTPWTVKQGLCCSAVFEFLAVASKFEVSFQSRLVLGLSVTFSDFQFSPSKHLTSEKLLKLLAKQNGPLLARLERVQVGQEFAGWFWRVQELQTPNIHHYIRQNHPQHPKATCQIMSIGWRSQYVSVCDQDGEHC